MNKDQKNNNKDSDFLEKIRSDDEDAYEDLFYKYYFQLTRFAWRYVRSKAVAEEIVQGMFAKLWERRKELTLSEELKSWLYKTVRNDSLNYLKHQEVRRKYDPLWMDQKQNPTIEFRDVKSEERLQEDINQAIEELPSRCKMTFMLNRYDGLTYSEIADVMNISEKTVEAQITRALKHLRERLKDYLPILMIFTHLC